jgi:hypothetical protein
MMMMRLILVRKERGVEREREREREREGGGGGEPIHETHVETS